MHAQTYVYKYTRRGWEHLSTPHKNSHRFPGKILRASNVGGLPELLMVLDATLTNLFDKGSDQNRTLYGQINISDFCSRARSRAGFTTDFRCSNYLCRSVCSSMWTLRHGTIQKICCQKAAAVCQRFSLTCQLARQKSQLSFKKLMRGAAHTIALLNFQLSNHMIS